MPKSRQNSPVSALVLLVFLLVFLLVLVHQAGALAVLVTWRRFLKHVERTRLLMFVVDLAGFQFKPDSPHRSALDTVLLLNKSVTCGYWDTGILGYWPPPD